MMNMNHKRVLIRSLISTAALWVLFYIIGAVFGLFQVMCKPGGDCPSQFEIYLQFSLFLLPVMLAFAFAVNYAVELLRKKS